MERGRTRGMNAAARINRSGRTRGMNATARINRSVSQLTVC